MSYDIKGVELPGVTSILGVLGKGDGLLYWSVNCAIDYINQELDLDTIRLENNIDIKSLANILSDAKFEWKNMREEAMSIGSEVHNMIEQYIKANIDGTELPKYDGEYKDEVENSFLAFLEWEKENITKFLKCEHTVYNLAFGFAGTLDLIAKMKDDKIHVIDFKTCSLKDKNDKIYPIFPEHIKQIAAYRYAVTGMQIDGMGIVRLDKKTGEMNYKDVSAKYNVALRSFLKLVDFYYSDKKRRLKNNPMVRKYYE